MPKKGPSEVGIEEVRAAIDARGFGWEAGETSVSNLSLEDKLLLLGYTPGPDEPSLEEQERISLARLAEAPVSAEAAGYPTTFDWRNFGGRNFVSPIRNQSQCGSCVAFGTLATIEATARVRRNDSTFSIDLSEAHLFYCLGAAAGRNCANGWWPTDALDGVKATGVVDESCFPYTAGDQPCNLCSGWQSRVTKITGWHALTSATDMRTWLSTKGPLITCFSVYADFVHYTSGVYRRTVGGVPAGHCVSVIGYDDVNQFWICKNSWGAGWGEQGYFCIAYGECGIDSTMWGVDDVVSPSTTTGALYRYWNSSIGDHFYTTNWAELGSGRYGWAYEGIQCYVYKQNAAGTVPLYRYWNSSIGDHFYTTNWAELGSGRYGWAYEGIQCYVCPGAAPYAVPLYRYWNASIGDHFYTTNWSELGSGRYGWAWEGVQCYVLTSAAAAAPDDQGDAGEPIPESFTAQGDVAGTAPQSFMTAGTPGGLEPVPPTFASPAASAGGGEVPDSFR